MNEKLSVRTPSTRSGFHEGEIAVQTSAGVRSEADRLRRMLEPADLRGGAASFLATQTFAVLSGRDRAGRLWISPLAGAPGFLSVAGPSSLLVRAEPRSEDPLRGLPGGQQVGLLVIDLARRRRFRVNGLLLEAADPEHSGAGTLRIEADQAFGNCPQYIQQRVLVAGQHDDKRLVDGPVSTVVRPVSDRLSAADIALIAEADTFFLGTTHPERGGDASHRGGPPGFTRVVDAQHLWWPDYPGNNLFTSLGNLAVDPTCALLWCDFTTGRTLHVSGTARLETTAPGAPGDDGGTGRRVRFTVEQARAGARLPIASVS